MLIACEGVFAYLKRELISFQNVNKAVFGLLTIKFLPVAGVGAL